jgi:hypothetical protein
LSTATNADGQGGTILLKGKINEAPAICLFDTGAESNFLSQHFVERHGLQALLQPSKLSVRYADGHVKAVRGEITLPLRLLADTTPFDISTRFVVADLQRQFDLILGIPFCQKHEPRPDWAEMTIRLVDQRVGRNQAWRRVYKASPRDPKDGGADYASQALGEISLSAMEQLRRTKKLGDVFCIHLQPAITAVSGCATEQEAATLKEQTRIADLRAQLFKEYAAVFPDSLPKLDGTAAPKPGTIVHGIELHEGAKPYSQPLRRMSTQEMDELKKQLQEYIDTGRIRPSESPWGANVIFAKKKDGSL